MNLYRLILSEWAYKANPSLPKVYESEFSNQEIKDLNAQGYNIYYLPNYPSVHDTSKAVDGSEIDIFRFAFIDMDLKDGVYKTKQEFIDLIKASNIEPTYIIDSGRGVHVYYQVSDLDALSFLRFQRRLCRKFNTDDAVSKIYQLMRVPGTFNTKDGKDAYKACEAIFTSGTVYTGEDLDKLLPPITQKDEDYCLKHYNKTYNINQTSLEEVDDELPSKFLALITDNEEVKEIWRGDSDNRSKSDFRLAHIMLANGFSKTEAMSVLVNCQKALGRAPKHRISYASNIIDKIWIDSPDTFDFSLAHSVQDILNQNNTTEGARFRCSPLVDATEHGFRLGQVMGLVGGSGSGKTTFTLNMFKWFVERNPEYVHFFVSLEQPVHEIAARWATMCGENKQLHNKVFILGNYNDDGSHRMLSLSKIKDYIVGFQNATGKKAGCVVIDHIGALKKSSKDGEFQSLIDICQEMKAFAIQTNTFLIMQSQTSREKAGIGDIELDKDAAYGTTNFEWFCDFLVTIWQPLKRVYKEASHMTVTAFKFCKIRNKHVKLDNMKEDTRYSLLFDPDTEEFRELTQKEKESFVFLNSRATTARKQDKKTDVLTYDNIGWSLNEGK